MSMNCYVMLYASGTLHVNRELQLVILWFYQCGTLYCD